MKKGILFILLMVKIGLFNLCAQKQGYEIFKVEPIDKDRAAQIASMLSDRPKGIGDPIEKREIWDKLYRSGNFNTLIKEADSISKIPFPKLTEEIYMNYYKGKDSETSKRFIMKRRILLTKLIWAECISNTNKYMPAIRNALNDILNTTSWSFPAEDANKTNYQGTLHTIGLSSSAYGNEVAQSLYLLRSKLDNEMKKNIVSSLYKKVFNPTLNALRNNNANKEFTWLTSSGNHNSVTLSNVTSAALAVIQDKNERALFVAIAERYSNNSLVGFTDDGYCSEGVGYYTYGFGHYILLRENIWQATQGKSDLFERPKIDKVVHFVPGMEIINGVYAAIGDCEPYIQPGKQVMYYLNKNFKLGLKNYEKVLIDDIEQPTLANIMYFFPNSASLAEPVTISIKKELRHYFNIAGVLTVRPSTTKGFDMGATFKGGNNNEHHNHNDVGSYSIAMGEKIIMGDPGLGIYTPTYFGPDRYTYKTTSSYGHPVPVVAGIQQSVGKDSRAIILDTNFTDNKDVFSMDISSAYNVPTLKKLVRTFTYGRSDEGFTEVKDDISFSSPQSYESALITRANWKQLAKNIIEFSGPSGKMIAEITAPASFSILSEEITEAREPYTRIAIRLDKPISFGTLSIVFRPQKNTLKTKKNN